MRLRVRTDRWTTMFFAALGLTPACGGSVTDNAGSGGTDGGASGGGAGGSSTSSASATGAGGDIIWTSATTGVTSGTSSVSVGAGGSVGVSTSAGAGGSVAVGTSVGTGGMGTGGGGTGGTGGGHAFPCEGPQPVGDPANGYVSCRNGSVHRPTKASCPTSVPRPAPVTDGGVTFPGGPPPMCTKDSDCPPRSYCGTYTGNAPPYFQCVPGCVTDSDCSVGKICVCGDPMGTCIQATCTVDADCGQGLFCSTYATLPGCPMQAFGCQTQADQCGGDADCTNAQQCALQNGHRVCAPRSCQVGRPFLIGDEDRVAPLDARADWIASRVAPDASRLGAAERALLSRAWAKIGQMEHASVAAFARFTLHLMSLGAPATLIERSNAALSDETLHAKLAFAIASGYAGRAIGPGALAIDGAFASSRWQDILVTTIHEGCIGETVAAIEAAEALEYAEDAEVRRALTRIADDEYRHAELAWRFVGWVITRFGDEAKDLARGEFARAEMGAIEQGDSPTTGEERCLLAGGIVPERLRREVKSQAIRRVVRVCADALLEGGESPVSSSRAA